MVASILDRHSARRIDGEPCNSGQGRKLVTESPASRGNGPIYWACIPVADYEARRAKEQAPGSARGSGASASAIYGRLVRVHFVLRSVVAGTVTALVAWVYAFGWRWRVRTNEL